MKKIFFILCMGMLLAGCSKGQDDPDREVQEVSEDSKRQEDDDAKTAEPAPDAEPAQTEAAEAQALKRTQTIVLDPGHSAVVAPGTEPLGPGSSEYKSADASGTAGVSTGIPEYELTLNVSLQLKQELEARGYTVLMTRESNDVLFCFCTSKKQIFCTA